MDFELIGNLSWGGHMPLPLMPCPLLFFRQLSNPPFISCPLLSLNRRVEASYTYTSYLLIASCLDIIKCRWGGVGTSYTHVTPYCLSPQSSSFLQHHGYLPPWSRSTPTTWPCWTRWTGSRHTQQLPVLHHPTPQTPLIIHSGMFFINHPKYKIL